MYDLSLLKENPSYGLRLIGSESNSLLGSSLSPAGDFNCNGLGDILLGAPGESNGTGAAYILYGIRNASLLRMLGGVDTVLSAGLLEGGDEARGLVIPGLQRGDQLGFSVAAGGDVNGDGHGDVVLGAPQGLSSSLNSSGRGYVLFGPPPTGGESSSFDLSLLDGSNGFLVAGAESYDLLGASVSSTFSTATPLARGNQSCGKDGRLWNVLLGAYQAADSAGKAYKLWGKDTSLPSVPSFPAEVSLSSILGENSSASPAIRRCGAGHLPSHSHSHSPTPSLFPPTSSASFSLSSSVSASPTSTPSFTSLTVSPLPSSSASQPFFTLSPLPMTSSSPSPPAQPAVVPAAAWAIPVALFLALLLGLLWWCFWGARGGDEEDGFVGYGFEKGVLVEIYEVDVGNAFTTPLPPLFETQTEKEEFFGMRGEQSSRSLVATAPTDTKTQGWKETKDRVGADARAVGYVENEESVARENYHSGRDQRSLLSSPPVRFHGDLSDSQATPLAPLSYPIQSHPISPSQRVHRDGRPVSVASPSTVASSPSPSQGEGPTGEARLNDTVHRKSFNM